MPKIKDKWSLNQLSSCIYKPDRKKVEKEYIYTVAKGFIETLGYSDEDKKVATLKMMKDKDNQDAYKISWFYISPKVLDKGSIIYKNSEKGIEIKKYWGITSDTLKNHFFGSESSIKRPIKYLKEFSGDPQLALNARFIHDKTLGLTEHIFSDTLLIDIDNKDNNPEKAIKTIKALLKEMDYKIPIHFDFNPTTKAAHIYYKFSQPFYHKCSTNFVKYFNNKYKDEGLKIDTRYKTKIFRLPLSFSYIGLNIQSKDDLINLDFNKVFDNKLENMLFALHFERDYPEEIIRYKPFKDKVEQDVSVVAPTPRKVPVYTRSTKQGKKPEQTNTLKNIYTDFPIYSGERIITMGKLFRYCKCRNYSKQDFIQACISNNKTSKDFCRWSLYKSQLECSRFWDSFERTYRFPSNYNLFRPQNFISNIEKYLPDDLQKECDKVAKMIFKHEYEPFMNYDKWKEETKKAIPIILKEVLGYYVYNEQTDRKKNEQSTLTDKKFAEISKGCQISRVFLNRLKEHYNFKIDVHRIYKKLTRLQLFEQIYSNDQGWCYGLDYSFCKQFRLKLQDNQKDLLTNLENNLNNVYNIFILLNNKLKKYKNDIYIMINNIILKDLSFEEWFKNGFLMDYG